MMPKVSVVMPVYKGERYLTQAIESILGQTYRDFEFLILCEYGTEQSTLELISRYASKDDRIVLSVNDIKLGISASLNRGFRVAKGEYYARMDGDDISLPERLNIQVELMDGKPDVGICGGGAVCIDENGKPLNINDDYSEDPEQIKSDLLFYCFMRHPTVMFRKSAIIEHNLYYNEDYMSTEDYELWCRAAHLVKFAKAPGTLLKYRWYKDNATHIFHKEGIENYLKIMRLNFSYLGLNPSDTELRYLCPQTCNETYNNHREIKNLLDSYYDIIIERNKVLKVYDEGCLKNTLNRRMYWKRHKIRRIAVVVIKSMAGMLKAEILDSLAGNLECYGFIHTLRRIFSLVR